MRPLRNYLFTYERTVQSDPEAPSHLQIVKSGHSPCDARRKAFTALEEKLRQQDLPRTGWRLARQQHVPF